ncbi:retinoic acid receptor responder protein 1 [Artibeus jamaicensis]|uniref:retinoic acid receptor responder protein 1 n=1 Tax=Artibeus jamaicensis TaxID=9417 RepID=UPI00235A4AF3|nr:retinoic acid receptor responder protein 1 [Artibeus jamaicensis]
MQLRQQPLSAPGPRGPRPAAPLLAPLLLLLLLALQGAGAVPVRPRVSREYDDYYPRMPPWALPRGILEQAAHAALHFLNFRVGSPSALRELSLVQAGSAWMTLRKEYHTDLGFTTKRFNPKDGKEEPLGECFAQVLFKKEKPRPTVNVTCERFLEKSRQQREDYLLYKHLKQLKVPLGAVSIPDSHGHIDPALRPVWDLAFLGGSYVMWEKTTHVLRYNLAQLTGVQQWKTDDDTIDFEYTVLLHEFSTQEIISCSIHLVWYPGKPLKVKSYCQGQQTSDEASEAEEGSAVAPTELSNF